MRRVSGLIAGLLLAVVALGLVDVVDRTTYRLGPFRPAPAVTIYLDHEHKNSSIRLLVRSDRKNRVMVRVFDADEQLVYWKYTESRNTPLVVDKNITLTGRGIYQVRVNAENDACRVYLTVPREMGYGVSYQNGYWNSWWPRRLTFRGFWPHERSRTWFVFVPPHAEELKVASCSPRLSFVARDETGRVLKFLRRPGSAVYRLPVRKTKVVWTFEFPRREMGFLAEGFPLILCSTRKAAEKIHASVEQLKDGTVITQKFQRRINKCLVEILQPKNVGKADDLVADLKPYEHDLMRDPARNWFLVNPFDGLLLSINPILRNQNTDPRSRWSGAVYGWRERVGKPYPENRWDRLKSINGLRAGISDPSVYAAGEKLALAATLKIPGNPYYGKKELLYRAAAIALRDLMTLGEDEIWRGVNRNMEPYPGGMAFPMGRKDFPVYALVAPHMPADVREVWTEALRRIVDRTYTDPLVSCRNQSAHYLLAYQDFAEGSGMKLYKKLAAAYAKRFAESASPAGYFMEAGGPDAEYTGITHWLMAVYYRKTHDPVILEALRKSYDFFNHTVAPEPDGTLLGASNFCHRTKGGFQVEFWGGATGILDDVLAETGLFKKSWYTPIPYKHSRKEAQEIRNKIHRILENPPTNLSLNAYNLEYPRYKYWRPRKKGIWPALEKKDFIRDFGGELVAVKRSGYYAAVYVGKPSRLIASGIPAEAGGSRPHPMGGLCLFWTRDFGNCVLAANWSPLTHHGLVAVDSEGHTFTEEYRATQHELNQRSGELVVTGRIADQPVSYRRHYFFRDQKLEIHLELRIEKPCDLVRLAEVIPIVTGDKTKKRDWHRIRVLNDRDQPGLACAVLITDRSHHGIRITFQKPREVHVYEKGIKCSEVPGLEIGRVEIPMPTKLKAGEVLRLSYVLSPESQSQ